MKLSNKGLAQEGSPSILTKIFAAREIERMECVVRLDRCKQLVAQLLEDHTAPDCAPALVELRGELRVAYALAVRQFLSGESLGPERSVANEGEKLDVAVVGASHVPAWIVNVRKALSWTR